MPIRTTTDYWSIIEKSGLFDEAKLAGLRQRYEHVADAPLLARKLIDARLLTDWQARFLLTGRHHLKVGQYVLLERIPSRHVGDRFLAIHKGLDRHVEVNLFPPSIAKNEQLFQRFLTQASRVVGMDHRNLVHLYDIEREGTRYYFVYEHDTGTPLDQLAPGQLDVPAIADITHQILDGLRYAHKNHLIHGQLNESQIRIDEKNQVRISDIGLAPMMDQLAQLEGTGVDEPGNRPRVNEDTSAVGRIGLKLLEDYDGDSADNSYWQLKAIMVDLSLVAKCDDQTIREFMARIDTWTGEQIAAQAASLPVEPSTTLANDTATHVQLGQPADRYSPVATPARKTAANAVVASSRAKRIGTIAGGLVAVVLGGLAFYMFFGRGSSGADLSQARTLEQVTHGNKKEGLRPHVLSELDSANAQTTTHGNSGKSKRKSSLDTVVGGLDGNDTDSSQIDNAELGNLKSNDPARVESGLSKPGDRLGAEPPPNIQETKDNSQPKLSRLSPQESATVDAPVIGQTWNGLPVIDWKEAADFVDQEVVVSGKVVRVGKSASGAIHFLNFDKSGRDTFTVIIREENYDKFPGDIETLYKNKFVAVSGKVFLFQDRVPEIEITSADQILVTNEPGSDQPEMAAGTSGQDDSSTGGKSATGAGNIASTHLANLPPALSIPEFESGDLAMTPVLLGNVNSGNELLGMEIVRPNGFCKKGLVFTIDRDASDVNRWEIRYAEREADIPLVVAEITKVDSELRFRWIAPAGTVNTINYLQNCLLRIKSPADSKLCALRVPVEIEPIVFTNKKAAYRENLPVTWIPNGEFIIAELQQFSLEDLPGQNSENGYEVSANQPSTEVYFQTDALQRFLAIGFGLDAGSQIKIEAGLLHNSLSGFMPYRESTFRDLGTSVSQLQRDLQNKKMVADNYDPPYGEKTKHKDYVKELSKQLDLINLQVEGYNAANERLQKILDRPVHFRVIFKSDDVEIELARTRGLESNGTATADSESK